MTINIEEFDKIEYPTYDSVCKDFGQEKADEIFSAMSEINHAKKVKGKWELTERGLGYYEGLHNTMKNLCKNPNLFVKAFQAYNKARINFYEDLFGDTMMIKFFKNLFKRMLKTNTETTKVIEDGIEITVKDENNFTISSSRELSSDELRNIIVKHLGGNF